MSVIVSDLLIFSCLNVCVPWIVIAIARTQLAVAPARCGDRNRATFAPALGRLRPGATFVYPHG